MVVSKHDKILQYSPPRSGSTVTWRLLDLLFGIYNPHINKWVNPDVVFKSHDFADIQKFIQKRHPVVITLRDPVDTVMSILRKSKKISKLSISILRTHKHILRKEYIDLVDLHTRVLENYKNHKLVCILSYETLMNNPRQFVLQIASFFKIPENEIPWKPALAILNPNLQCLPKAGYDPKTLLHWDHIGPEDLNERQKLHRFMIESVLNNML